MVTRWICPQTAPYFSLFPLQHLTGETHARGQVQNISPHFFQPVIEELVDISVMWVSWVYKDGNK